MGITFESADPRFRPALESLLRSHQLPIEDLPGDLEGFTLALDSGFLVGSVGMEQVGHYGLLRSFVVLGDYRKKGVGRRLYEQALNSARNAFIREVWLITTSADAYFERQGFERIDRENVPPEISATSQFTSLCPSSAIVMRKHI